MFCIIIHFSCAITQWDDGQVPRVNCTKHNVPSSESYKIVQKYTIFNLTVKVHSLIFEKQSLLLYVTGYTSCFMQFWYMMWSSERQSSLMKQGRKAKRASRTPKTTGTSENSSVSNCRFTERCDICVQPICLFLQHGKECVPPLGLFLQVQSKNMWFKKSSWVTCDLDALWASQPKDIFILFTVSYSGVKLCYIKYNNIYSLT